MTLPPCPPSPPLGPPRGTYFSRLKLTQPRPPSPAFTKMWTSSRNIWPVGTRASGGGFDQDEAAEPPAIAEADATLDQGEQRVVPTAADMHAGLPAGAALPHDDRPGSDQLAVAALDAKPLGVRITPVPARTLTFLVRHLPSLRLDGVDADLEEVLAVARRLAVPLALLLLEYDHLLGAQLAHQGALDRRPSHQRLAHHDAPGIANEENAIEHDLGARLRAGPHPLHRDPLPHFHAVLLATSFHDSVHADSNPTSRGTKFVPYRRASVKHRSRLPAGRTPGRNRPERPAGRSGRFRPGVRPAGKRLRCLTLARRYGTNFVPRLVGLESACTLSWKLVASNTAWKSGNGSRWSGCGPARSRAPRSCSIAFSSFAMPGASWWASRWWLGRRSRAPWCASCAPRR